MGLYRDKFSFTFNSAQSEEKSVFHCQAAAPGAVFLAVTVVPVAVLEMYVVLFLLLWLLLPLLLLCILQICSPVLMFHLPDNT
jgi:hypothetical protein